MERYIYKCFATVKNKYMYVRDLNIIVGVDEREYCELDTYNDDTDAIKKYKKLGILFNSRVKEIEHQETDVVEFLVNNYCEQLTLQVTQQCNLRCDYCIYSGAYNTRTHNKKKMNLLIAKQAIDFFISHARLSNSIFFSFYGGEPLLEYTLIKKCVEYIKDKVEGKKVGFGMTTNGTLLTDEIVDFLVANDFQLSISLDGDKDSHNKSRKFISGKGSFDLILTNVKRIYERYPEYGKSITFLPVLDEKIDWNKTSIFFNENEIFKQNPIIFSSVNPIGLIKKRRDDVSINNELFIKFEYLKLFYSLIGRIKEDNISRIIIREREKYKRLYEKLHRHSIICEKSHPEGPCIPGGRRLFVTADGEFCPCERVNEIANCCRIGNIYEGFDIDKIKSLLNIGKITKEECLECWNLPNCSMCIGQLELLNGEINKELKMKECVKEKNRVSKELYEIAVLCEFGYGRCEVV